MVIYIITLFFKKANTQLVSILSGRTVQEHVLYSLAFKLEDREVGLERNGARSGRHEHVMHVLSVCTYT